MDTAAAPTSQNQAATEDDGTSLIMTGNPPETHPSTEREKSVGFSESEQSSGYSKVNNKYQVNNNGTGQRRSVTSSSVRSSMTLRRQPVDELLVPRASSISAGAGDTAASSQALESEFEDEHRNDILHKTCLRPGFTLNKQLMLSFGIINAFTIIFVLGVCLIVAFTAGDTLKEINEIEFETLAQERQGATARYLAESLGQKLMLFDSVRLIGEATQDRFEGYPEASDDFVPFPDVLTNRNIYPVSVDPEPFDWQLEPGVDESNYDEFLHSETRWNFYKSRPLNAGHSAFQIQGSCDPSVTDPEVNAYYENCTDANNNATTGGVVAPSPTTELIHRKASDLTPMLRALFEARSEIRDLGLYFKNSGAGASFNYPQYITSSGGGYTSVGCEWMKLPNPLDETKPLGTQEEIDRCHPDEEFVTIREYNAMERNWCILMALNPDRILTFVGPDSWNLNQYLLTLGQAIYDRTTKEFIACSYVGIQIGAIDEELTKYKVTENSEVSIVVWDKAGNVASSTKLDSDSRRDESVTSVFEIDVGLTEGSWEELWELVDYEKEWDPQDVRKAYENFRVVDDFYLVATHPMPPVPKEYDPTYRPIFLVITSTARIDIQGVVNDVNDIIDENVNQTNIYAIIISCIGLAVSLSIIVVMAHVITSPLQSMNATANDIVNQFGDPSAEHLISRSNKLHKVNSIAPKTELSDVVLEFNKMVLSFSGKGMAKADKGKQEEVENIFNIRKPFFELYQSREDKSFKYSIFENKARVPDPLDELSYRNEGSNLLDASAQLNGVPMDIHAEKKKSSPLFLWISVLIVVPLLLVTILVASLVLSGYTASVRDFLEKAESHFLDVEKAALAVHTVLRADYIAGLSSKAITDLHLVSRYSSWLLFGGLNTTEAFTELYSGQEQCKNYTENTMSECPYLDVVDYCDCSWNDEPLYFQCRNYENEIDSRSLQKQYFAGESSGIDPITGDRNVTLFPLASYSPETTSWYTDQRIVPGSESYPSSSETDTTYGRLRKLANSPILEILYNYQPVGRPMVGSFVATEADGFVVGFSGCRWGEISFSRWKSTESNRAAELRPELCPLGKHGYDPRCREWYDTGKKQYENSGTSLYVTSPYRFASDGLLIAQTATTALFHPQTGEHVGQVLFDFRTTPIYNALDIDTEFKEGGFPVVITTAGFANDTVIAPGFDYNTETAVPLVEKVMKYDFGCSDDGCIQNLGRFDELVSAMKAGNNSVEREDVNIQFDRRKEDGSTETYFMAYAPVNVKSFELIDTSDFSRGARSTDLLIYSIGLANSKETMLQPFRAMEKKVKDSITIAIVTLSVVVAIATLSVLYLSRRLASSVTKPMLYLLELIRSINRNGVGQDVTASKKVRASYEIVGFCDTMEILYKLVRSANSAFHAGELEVAYKVLVDALRLFKRLGNKKAIAVASNNIGNTVLGMYRELKASKAERLCNLKKKDMVRIGIGHFHTSIQMGERGYDEFHLAQGWTPACLDFTQHLANRYFNRGLFLLMTKDDHDKPQELEALGNRDLQITRDMDHEVIAYGEDIGWGAADRIASSFSVNLVRLRGYNQLIDMGYEDEWNVEDLIEDSFAMVKNEAQKPSSKLFDGVRLAGRMQQIETELMKYLMRTEKEEDAARVAIRMLFEDEIVFVDALSTSIEVLLKYLDVGSFEDGEREKLRETLEDYHEYLKVEAVKQKQSEIFALESSLSVKRSSEFVKNVSTRHLDSERLSVWTLKDCSGKFVTMEDF